MVKKTNSRRNAAFLTSQHDHHSDSNIAKKNATASVTKHSFHAIVIQSFLACFIIMMSAYVIAFWGQAEARFMVVASIGYFLIYVGLPLLMLRFEHEKGQTIRAFLRSRIKICYGEVTGKDILLQVCLIPFMLCLCTIIICITLIVLRP